MFIIFFGVRLDRDCKGKDSDDKWLMIDRGERGGFELKFRLRRTYLLIDALHGIKQSDRVLLSHLQRLGIPHQIILSKIDRIIFPRSSSAPVSSSGLTSSSSSSSSSSTSTGGLKKRRKATRLPSEKSTKENLIRLKNVMDDLRRAISSEDEDGVVVVNHHHRHHHRHNTTATLGEILGVSAEKICPRIVVSDHRHRRPHRLHVFPLFDHHSVGDHQPDTTNDDDDDDDEDEDERHEDGQQQQQDRNFEKDEKRGKGGEAAMVVRKTTLGISGLRWSILVATGLDSFSPPPSSS